MNFLTDRKRAVGLGAGGSGAQQHWKTIATSIALLFLVPSSILIVGCALGGTHSEVLAFFARPVPAIMLAISLVIGISHLKIEAQEAIEDYIGGIKRKLTLIALSGFCYVLTATGLFALLKLALS